MGGRSQSGMNGVGTRLATGLWLNVLLFEIFVVLPSKERHINTTTNR